MAIRKGTSRFWLRMDKRLKDGRVPLFLIYSVKGQRKNYDTRIRIFEEQWDDDNREIRSLNIKLAKTKYGLKLQDLPSKEEIEEDNGKILRLRSSLGSIESRFILDGVAFSSEMVIAQLSELMKPEVRKEKQTNDLGNFMDRYIAENESNRVRGSLHIYKNVRKRIREFEKHYRCSITFDTVNYDFFTRFQSYLINNCHLNNTTTAKLLSTVKTFLNYAKRYGHQVPDNYKDFKIKRESLEVIALTQDEFNRLYSFDFSNYKRLDQVRDVFIFSCASGLRFSDLALLNRAQIKEDSIVQNVKKTKQILSIPLNRYSRAILEKYSQEPTPLPVISNQKSNLYLHEACKLAGIDEPIEIVRFKGIRREVNVYPKHELITMHVGRKTFCTLSLEKGMNAEETMSISGHKDYKSFKRYINVTEERKKLVMKKAWD